MTSVARGLSLPLVAGIPAHLLTIHLAAIAGRIPLCVASGKQSRVVDAEFVKRRRAVQWPGGGGVRGSGAPLLREGAQEVHVLEVVGQEVLEDDHLDTRVGVLADLCSTSFQPAPRPSSTRPALISSMVATTLATLAG